MTLDVVVVDDIILEVPTGSLQAGVRATIASTSLEREAWGGGGGGVIQWVVICNLTTRCQILHTAPF